MNWSLYEKKSNLNTSPVGNVSDFSSLEIEEYAEYLGVILPDEEDMLDLVR